VSGSVREHIFILAVYTVWTTRNIYPITCATGILRCLIFS